MYAYIRGELAEIEMDHIVVEANGIGYNLYISNTTFDSLPQIGKECKIYTYLHVREDAMILYGFLTKAEVLMFRQLIMVSGIGPKAALGILSVFSVEELRFAIVAQDVKTISKAPGIGAKTAQRVILELKDKVNLEDTLEKKWEKEQIANADLSLQVRNDAVLALNALGYSSAESLKAVSHVTITEEMRVEEVLKLALKFLL